MFEKNDASFVQTPHPARRPSRTGSVSTDRQPPQSSDGGVNVVIHGDHVNVSKITIPAVPKKSAVVEGKEHGHDETKDNVNELESGRGAEAQSPHLSGKISRLTFADVGEEGMDREDGGGDGLEADSDDEHMSDLSMEEVVDSERSSAAVTPYRAMLLRAKRKALKKAAGEDDDDDDDEDGSAIEGIPTVLPGPEWRLVYVGNDNNYACGGLLPDDVIADQPHAIATITFSVSSTIVILLKMIWSHADSNTRLGFPRLRVESDECQEAIFNPANSPQSGRQ